MNIKLFVLAVSLFIEVINLENIKIQRRIRIEVVSSHIFNFNALQYFQLCLSTQTTIGTTIQTETTVTVIKACGEDDYMEGVRQHSEKCAASVQFFRGPTQKMGQTLSDALASLETELDSLRTCSSQIISSQSIAILQNISLMRDVGSTPETIIEEFAKVIHLVANGYKTIVSDLSAAIGCLATAINDDIDKLVCELEKIMVNYEQAAIAESDDGEIDYKSAVNAFQNLSNTIARISETALGGCDVDDNVRDSIFVLGLILDHFSIMSHGTTTSIAAALYRSDITISYTLRMCLRTVDPLVGGLAQALRVATNSVTESVTVFLTSIVNLTKSLNNVLKNVFGLVANVAVSATEITQSLTKSVSSIAGVFQKLFK